MAKGQNTEVTITAENQFSGYVAPEADEDGSVTVIGTGSMTITLQVLPDGETVPIDVDSVTAAGRYTFAATRERHRIGCKTGDFTSGTMRVLLHA